MQLKELICPSCEATKVPAGGSVETTCMSCGESLLSRHVSGYLHCATCSEQYRVCMVCGEFLPTPKFLARQKLMVDIQNTLIGVKLTNQIENQVLQFETPELIGKIHYNEVLEYDRNGYSADLMLMVESKERFERWGNCFYQKEIQYAESIPVDLTFIQDNIKEVQCLAMRDYVYHSRDCSPDYRKWYARAWIDISTKVSR